MYLLNFTSNNEYTQIADYDGLRYQVLHKELHFYMTVTPLETILTTNLWSDVYLRRSYFANGVFDSLNVVTEQAELGLAEMSANKSATRQLTNRP